MQQWCSFAVSGTRAEWITLIYLNACFLSSISILSQWFNNPIHRTSSLPHALFKNQCGPFAMEMNICISDNNENHILPTLECMQNTYQLKHITASCMKCTDTFRSPGAVVCFGVIPAPRENWKTFVISTIIHSASSIWFLLPKEGRQYQWPRAMGMNDKKRWCQMRWWVKCCPLDRICSFGGSQLLRPFPQDNPVSATHASITQLRFVHFLKKLLISSLPFLYIHQYPVDPHIDVQLIMQWA